MEQDKSSNLLTRTQIYIFYTRIKIKDCLRFIHQKDRLSTSKVGYLWKYDASDLRYIDQKNMLRDGEFGYLWK